MALRGWLGGVAVAAVVLAGCDLHTDGPVSPVSTSGPTASATPSADDQVLDRAVADIVAARAVVVTGTHRQPHLHAELTPLLDLHAAHLSALSAQAPTPAITPGRASRRQVRDAVRGAEHTLAEQLAYQAGRAGSGQLARLLASMAAAVHQRADPAGVVPVLPPLDRATTRDDGEVDALQRALAAEYAAVYVDGVLGAQTSQSDPLTTSLYTELSLDYAAHLARRDDLVAALVAAGATPVVSAVAYDVPVRLDRTAVVERTARRLEASSATTYAFLVARSTGATRRWAVAVLRNDAIRELPYRGTPETFPGAGEFADR